MTILLSFYSISEALYDEVDSPKPFNNKHPIYSLNKWFPAKGLTRNINALYRQESHVLFAMRDINNYINDGVHKYYHGWKDNNSLLRTWFKMKEEPMDLLGVGVLDKRILS